MCYTTPVNRVVTYRNTLVADRDLSPDGKAQTDKKEKIIDNLLDFFTDAPFGTPDIINGFKNADKAFYLVEEEENRFLVMVTDEFVETRRLAKRITDKKFEIAQWKFRKCAYKLK